MAPTAPEPTGKVATRDGTQLSYSQSGPADGPNVLLIHGWGQSGAQWCKQISHLVERGYRVTAYDHRGHGLSDHPDPAGGSYTISTLAADLADLLAGLDLRGVTVVGHSMGCSVLWGFWDEHAGVVAERVRAAVFVDQSPHMLVLDGWTAEQAREVGGIFTAAQLDGLPGVFADMVPGLIRSMYTSAISEEDLAWSAAHGGDRFPAEIAIPLLQDHAKRDWRAVLPRINVPTLIIGAEGSLMPLECYRYTQKQIPGSQLIVFTHEERGSHFMFWENPEKFNSDLEDFIKGAL